MKKHAYLILAHGDIGPLLRLVRACDDYRNDIYIHYDKKYDLDDDKKMQIVNAASASEIYFVDRISVSWGGYSQIEAHLIMIKAALKGKYSYYHLLSGVDYPIKTQDYIHDFFDTNAGEEFVEFWNRDDFYFRVKYYYPLQEKIGTYSYDIKTLYFRFLSKLYVFWQKIRCVNRLEKFEGEWKMGSNWYSISDEFAHYVIENETLIYKLFNNGVAVDELYIQTLLWNSPFKDKISSIKTRLIDWNRGKPYTWQPEDIDEIIKSPSLFARKIISEELIREIDRRKKI